MEHKPTIKETKFLLPKPALSARDIKPPQWVNLVQSSWEEFQTLTPSQAKAEVLKILSVWPLFGSSFFAVCFFVFSILRLIQTLFFNHWSQAFFNFSIWKMNYYNISIWLKRYLHEHWETNSKSMAKSKSRLHMSTKYVSSSKWIIHFWPDLHVI